MNRFPYLIYHFAKISISLSLLIFLFSFNSFIFFRFSSIIFFLLSSLAFFIASDFSLFGVVAEAAFLAGVFVVFGWAFFVTDVPFVSVFGDVTYKNNNNNNEVLGLKIDVEKEEGSTILTYVPVILFQMFNFIKYSVDLNDLQHDHIPKSCQIFAGCRKFFTRFFILKKKYTSSIKDFKFLSKFFSQIKYQILLA